MRERTGAKSQIPRRERSGATSIARSRSDQRRYIQYLRGVSSGPGRVEGARPDESDLCHDVMDDFLKVAPRGDPVLRPLRSGSWKESVARTLCMFRASADAADFSSCSSDAIDEKPNSCAEYRGLSFSMAKKTPITRYAN